MASSRTLRVSAVVAVLAVAGCGGLKKDDAPGATAVNWRMATVESARSVRANAQSRSSQAGMGFLAGGLVGAAINSGAMDPKQSDTGAWEYAVRDGENVVTVRSFSVVGPGDCIRYAVNIAGDNVPLERLAPEMCSAK